MALPKKIPTMMSNVDFSPKPVNTVWMDVAKEYCNTYLQSGMNAGSGTTTLPGIAATLGGELMDATSTVTPVGMLTAVRMAKAFNNTLMQYLSLYQTTIVTAPGMPLLINELSDIMSAPTPNPVKMGQGIGKALDNFTASAVVIGVIPGAPPVPFTGPLS